MRMKLKRVAAATANSNHHQRQNPDLHIKYTMKFVPIQEMSAAEEWRPLFHGLQKLSAHTGMDTKSSLECLVMLYDRFDGDISREQVLSAIREYLNEHKAKACTGREYRLYVYDPHRGRAHACARGEQDFKG